MQIFSFDQLSEADLIVDAVYEGASGHLKGEPISKLLPGCGNMGGFRVAGRANERKFVVLYTSGGDKDWPDNIDAATGRFIYYGDNKTPGHELHDTPQKGNLLLKYVFESLHSSIGPRKDIPPFFVFQKFPTVKSSRSVQFKGIAVPGYPGVAFTEDLVAVWKTSERQRFQNYRALFTILDDASIKRKWVNMLYGNSHSDDAPQSFLKWKATGKYSPLISPPTTVIRNTQDQKPVNVTQEQIISTIFNYFKDNPKRFEACAAAIFRLHDDKAIIDEITRGAVDGGRDTIGRYGMGIAEDPVYVEFSLEAKCYQPAVDGNKPTTVGVKEVSRLISRIRNRQFGVLVTTSIVAKQAYEEVREDGHPIIFICGKDIVEILVKK